MKKKSKEPTIKDILRKTECIFCSRDLIVKLEADRFEVEKYCASCSFTMKISTLKKKHPRFNIEILTDKYHISLVESYGYAEHYLYKIGMTKDAYSTIKFPHLEEFVAQLPFPLSQEELNRKIETRLNFA